MADVLSFLNITIPQPPYTDKVFLDQANLVLEHALKVSPEVARVELSILELEYYGESEVDKAIYRAHMGPLYKWATTKHTAHVDSVFEGLSNVGLPLLPAFQTIVAQVSKQHLMKTEPIGNPSLKVVRQNNNKEYALIIMAELMYYLDESKESAANKAASRILDAFGEVRGCSSENLERNYDSSYMSFVEARDKQLSCEERKHTISYLEALS